MDDNKTDGLTEGRQGSRRGMGSQAALAAVLVVVIAGAGYVAYGQLQSLMREHKGVSNAPGPGMLAPNAGVSDEEWLATATESDGIVERFGEGEDVRVCASVPGGDGHCHAAAIKMLHELADANPDKMSVTVALVHSPAAVNAGMGCAGYRINGEGTYTYTKDDTVRTAVFDRMEGEAWTLDELRMAVESALKGEWPKTESGTESGSDTESESSAESALGVPPAE